MRVHDRKKEERIEARIAAYARRIRNQAELDELLGEEGLLSQQMLERIRPYLTFTPAQQ